MTLDSNHRLRDIGIVLALQTCSALSRAALARKLREPPEAVGRRLRLLHDDEVVVPVGVGRERRWALTQRYEHKRLSVAERVSWVLGRDHLAFVDGTLLKEYFDRTETDSPQGPWAGGRFEQKLYYLAEPARSYAEHTDTIDTVLDGLFKERTLSLPTRAPTG